MRLGVVLLPLLLAACGEERDPAPAPPAAVAAPKAAATQPSAYRVNAALPHGTIVVRVRAREGAESRLADIPAAFRSRNPEETAFCEGCASRGALPDESLLIDSATLGVRDVAVSIRTVAEGPLPPLARATLDNACCRFSPHVLFVPVGEKVLLKNSDPMSHATMISTLGGTTLFSVTIPSGETAETTTIDVPGILSATCPIHPWMRGFLIASRHPYAGVTDARGEVRLAQVPAGAHELVFWHERLGRAARTVEVMPGAEAAVALDASELRPR